MTGDQHDEGCGQYDGCQVVCVAIIATCLGVLIAAVFGAVGAA